MKVSKEASEKHRLDLLRAAGRLFREKGFDKVGVAEITAAAGLTHGAFYTHFRSKDDLCAKAVARLSRRTGEALKGTGDWRAYVDAYLSPRHVRDRGNGCLYAALGGDVPRESSAIRDAFGKAIDELVGDYAALIGEGGVAPSRHRAIAALATLVGGLVLARGAADPLSGEILTAVKQDLIGATRSSRRVNRKRSRKP
jgi:TetR/AcrR family transcriptional regulator, transcriptional repressor for nem operon